LLIYVVQRRPDTIRGAFVCNSALLDWAA
jgi:hypothetical protein